MNSKFLPEVKQEQIDEARNDFAALYDLLVQPLHEELYRRQDFNFLDDLSEGQQLMLSYDYIRMQVLQGGFIQLIQNGYVSLLLPIPAMLQKLGADEMAKAIDDALKVFVLNNEALSKETSVQEFAKLYNEFKEFEILDNKFQELDADTSNRIVLYALNNLHDFIKAS